MESPNWILGLRAYDPACCDIYRLVGSVAGWKALASTPFTGLFERHRQHRAPLVASSDRGLEAGRIWFGHRAAALRSLQDISLEEVSGIGMKKSSSDN